MPGRSRRCRGPLSERSGRQEKYPPSRQGFRSVPRLTPLWALCNHPTPLFSIENAVLALPPPVATSDAPSAVDPVERWARRGLWCRLLGREAAWTPALLVTALRGLCRRNPRMNARERARSVGVWRLLDAAVQRGVDPFAPSSVPLSPFGTPAGENEADSVWFAARDLAACSGAHLGAYLVRRARWLRAAVRERRIAPGEAVSCKRSIRRMVVEDEFHRYAPNFSSLLSKAFKAFSPAVSSGSAHQKRRTPSTNPLWGEPQNGLLELTYPDWSLEEPQATVWPLREALRTGDAGWVEELLKAGASPSPAHDFLRALDPDHPSVRAWAAGANDPHVPLVLALLRGRYERVRHHLEAFGGASEPHPLLATRGYSGLTPLAFCMLSDSPLPVRTRLTALLRHRGATWDGRGSVPTFLTLFDPHLPAAKLAREWAKMPRDDRGRVRLPAFPEISDAVGLVGVVVGECVRTGSPETTTRVIQGLSGFVGVRVSPPAPPDPERSALLHRILQDVLDAGADVEGPSELHTPLALALDADEGNRVWPLLLAAGADPRRQWVPPADGLEALEQTGSCALRVAFGRRPSAVLALCRAGANPSEMGSDGLTHHEWAPRFGSPAACAVWAEHRLLQDLQPITTRSREHRGAGSRRL